MTEPNNREYGTIEKDLTSVVGQVQKLVLQYHELNKELTHVADKIPENLDNRLIKIELQLAQIIKDIESEYVTQTEFAVYKVEHGQMKKLMWGFIIMVLTSVVGALLALVVHNAATVIK